MIHNMYRRVPTGIILFRFILRSVPSTVYVSDEIVGSSHKKRGATYGLIAYEQHEGLG